MLSTKQNRLEYLVGVNGGHGSYDPWPLVAFVIEGRESYLRDNQRLELTLPDMPP